MIASTHGIGERFAACRVSPLFQRGGGFMSAPRFGFSERRRMASRYAGVVRCMGHSIMESGRVVKVIVSSRAATLV